MAQIESVTTSGKIVTMVRGRVMRSQVIDHSRRRLPEVSKERRRVCVLSSRGGNELEHWGMTQPCFGPGCHHTHQTRESVADMVAKGIMKWVGIGKNVAAYSYGRTWKAMPSGRTREKVMQLV